MRDYLIPLTGDETKIAPYVIVCVIAVVLIIVLIIVSILSRKKSMSKLKGQDPELETVNLEDGETTAGKETGEKTEEENEGESPEDSEK